MEAIATVVRSLAGWTVVLALSLSLAAQQQPSSSDLPRYAVIDLGTLGGSFSEGRGINKQGWVAADASLSGDTAQHAVLWRDGIKTDLGTLGGPNSNVGVNGTQGPSGSGQVLGHSETSIADPLGEDFCGFGTYLTCLPFLWQDGVMSALPTLGGNNGGANAINIRGQVTGVVENSIIDSTCPNAALQLKPVVWENGKVQELPTFSGDPDGFANGINGAGQAVGGSGPCGSSLHALLWHGGKLTDLGNLGGSLYSNAYAINDYGQVAGSSDLPGDTNFFAGAVSTSHAFIWQHGSLTDLGTLSGDATSFGLGINNKSQVVGGFVSRAFIWQDGVITDLNTLVPGPPFSPLYLLAAEDINDDGEIVGLGLAITGEQHAFLAIPCDAAHAAVEECQGKSGATATNAATQPVTENPSSALSRPTLTPSAHFEGLIDRHHIGPSLGRYWAGRKIGAPK